MNDVSYLEAMERAAAALSAPGPVALACHSWPDGDALGSMLALHLLCVGQGKDCVSAWPEPDRVAPHYSFLPGLQLVSQASDFPPAPEVMVTFDSGSIERLGCLESAARRARELIVIDHHASNTRYGSVNLIDTEAAATAVVVRRLVSRLGWPLDRASAECLYTGLVTDTGRFQYSNTTPEVFAMAAELASFGLPIAEMSRELFEKSRFDYLKMVGEVLSRAELDSALGLVVAVVTAADLDRYGVALDETEGLIDILRRTAEADVAVVVKEAPGGTRVSLRSIGGHDVGTLALSMGGGGHQLAAGFVSPEPPDRVVARVRAALPGVAQAPVAGLPG